MLNVIAFQELVNWVSDLISSLFEFIKYKFPECIEYSKFVFENISNPTMFNDEDENYDEEVEVKVIK